MIKTSKEIDWLAWLAILFTLWIVLLGRQLYCSWYENFLQHRKLIAIEIYEREHPPMTEDEIIKTYRPWAPSHSERGRTCDFQGNPIGTKYDYKGEIYKEHLKKKDAAYYNPIKEDK